MLAPHVCLKTIKYGKITVAYIHLTVLVVRVIWSEVCHVEFAMSESEEKGVTILDAVRRAKEVSRVVLLYVFNKLARDHLNLEVMVILI